MLSIQADVAQNLDFQDTIFPSRSQTWPTRCRVGSGSGGEGLFSFVPRDEGVLHAFGLPVVNDDLFHSGGL